MQLDLDLRKTLNSGRRTFTLQVRLQSNSQRIVIVGPSGSGKSLTLKAIAGLLRPDAGYIRLDGRVLFDAAAGVHLPPQQREVAYVFQDYALFPHLTVRQNIAFSLAPGTSFDVTVEGLKPFDSAPGGFRSLDLETRSLLQALYFVAHGVDVPAEHLETGQARQTKTAEGMPFDWEPQLSGLFHVRSSRGGCSGDDAAVAVEYRGACFFIERKDHDTRATFALLIELARLEVPSNRQNAPILTLPLGQ